MSTDFPVRRAAAAAAASAATVARPRVDVPQGAGVGGRALRKAVSTRSKTYDCGEVLGNGSFGVVFQATCVEDGCQVAVKRVLQDPRYKNRELDIMKELEHPNIVKLRDYFYTEDADPDNPDAEPKRFLNVVMDFVPETVYRVLKSYLKSSRPMPSILVRLYTYQMCRALGYLHSVGICHRDIKPQNLLVDPKSHILKLCDFGSAKRLIPHDHSVAYICSRFYRAPELMLGATQYTPAIDIWSLGCVLGELLLGCPLFAGKTSVDQLVKIIQAMGTPTRRQMMAMNQHYTEFKFPDVSRKSWRRVFNDMLMSGHVHNSSSSPSGESSSDAPSSSTSAPSAHIDDDALDLINLLLQYDPRQRVQPYEVLGHPYFDQLRSPDAKTILGTRLPDLFNFSAEELDRMSPATRCRVIPSWYVYKT